MAADRLDSWKKIADYLGKSVSTVQRWEEEKNLPVHRLASRAADSARKQSGVFAFRDEIDQWLRDQRSNLQESAFAEADESEIYVDLPRDDEEPDGKPRFYPRTRLWFMTSWLRLVVGVLAVLALGCAALVIAPRFLTQPNPASATIENGSKLVVFDSAGRVLWTKLFEGPLMSGV